ncbi:MAG: SPRY-domain-containing protein [Monoraphidium minutum]|nr:MAG: SPRY-domain-containing protein [Monoraphidium minutum]
MSAAGMDPGPTELSSTQHGPHLEISKDRLSAKYTGDGRHDVGGIQANRAVPAKALLYYFEATVLDGGELGKIGVGFTPKDVKLTRQPGWEPGSYGYHGDDGMRYAASGKGEEYGPRFGVGDTVGAGLHLGRNEIFFTKNGNKLRTAFTNVRGAAGLIPTVGLHSRNESVALNFGAKPFRFDLESMIAEEKAAEQAAIRSVPVPPSAGHEVVHAYLLHYGYAATLSAFDAAAGLAGVEQPMSMEEDPAAASLAARCEARRLIMAGDMQAAVALLQGAYPRVLRGGAGSEEVQFHLSCQQYIELVRQRRVDEAVQFAQAVLAALLRGAPQWEGALKDVVALIVYEDPEASPLGHLMSRRQREKVADAVNAAVLSEAAGGGEGAGGEGGEGGGGAAEQQQQQQPLQSSLERLLAQLVAVQGALHDEAGGRGEPFDLRRHLGPPPPAGGGGSEGGGGGEPMAS